LRNEAEIIGDKGISGANQKLKDQNLTGEKLRNRLYQIISK
jgi:hypothetical protein